MATSVRIHPKSLAAWQRAVVRFQKNGDRNSQDPGIIGKIIRHNAPDIKRLWEIFTHERADIGRYLSDPKRQRSAYLIGFHLANVARLQLLLERSFARMPLLRDRLAEAQIVHVQDLGCGTGALSQGLISAAHSRKIDIAKWQWLLVDRQKSYLEAATFLLQQDSAQQVESIVGNVDGVRTKPDANSTAKTIDVLMMGNVWNELSRAPRARKHLLTHFARYAASKTPALLLIVEPANQNIARSLMELRDELTANGWLPNYPCPAAMACPMLERTRDWCFSEGNWQMPKDAQTIDRLLGTERAHLSGSMYAMINQPLAESLRQTGPADSMRVVVGKPRIPSTKHSKVAQIELLLCQATGLSKATPTATQNNLQRGECTNTPQ